MFAIIRLKIINLRNDIKVIGLRIIITLVMIAVFSSTSYSSSITVFAFIDNDNSELSQNLFVELNKQPGYRFDRYLLEDAKEAVKEDDVSGGILINKAFMDDILKFNETKIEKLLVTESMNNIQIDNFVLSSIKNVILNYNLSLGIVDIVEQAFDEKIYINKESIKGNVYNLIEEQWKYNIPIKISEYEKIEKYDALKQSVIGFSLLFAMFTIIMGISDILFEKENNTWNRQMVSPISKFSILMGNMIVTFLVGFIQVSLIFIVSKYLFGADFKGSIFNLLIVIASFVFAVASFGLFLSNFLKTMGQLSAITPIVITGSAMIGGCFWPLEIVNSKVLLLLSNITPQKWAMAAIKEIVVYGYGLEKVIPGVLVLLLMGIIYITIGTYFLNKRAI